MEYSIREFDFPSDYEAVIDLWEHAGPGIQLSVSDQADEIKKKLARDPDLFLVAEQEGQLIGTVLGGFDGRRGIMYHLAVAHPYRRHGLGKALMESLEERLRMKGCRKYYLLVTKDNQQALEFYTSQGCDLMPLYVLGKVIE
jgi:ribosomal protein S18 acetylase RimI-like enzyme